MPVGGLQGRRCTSWPVSLRQRFSRVCLPAPVQAVPDIPGVTGRLAVQWRTALAVRNSTVRDGFRVGCDVIQPPPVDSHLGMGVEPWAMPGMRVAMRLCCWDQRSRRCRTAFLVSETAYRPGPPVGIRLGSYVPPCMESTGMDVRATLSAPEGHAQTTVPEVSGPLRRDCVNTLVAFPACGIEQLRDPVKLVVDLGRDRSGIQKLNQLMQTGLPEQHGPPKV